MIVGTLKLSGTPGPPMGFAVTDVLLPPSGIGAILGVLGEATGAVGVVTVLGFVIKGIFTS